VIEIRAALDGGGLLRSCAISGHAGAGKRGTDIVCAAVSVLARTALQTLSAREGIELRGEAPERGIFRLEAEVSPENREARDFLAGAGAFLLEGLSSVARDYPDFCTMTIHRERRN
jgi:uncharacterized protein YsxB (DUF464 family)